jgi:hypothetical protein
MGNGFLASGSLLFSRAEMLQNEGFGPIEIRQKLLALVGKLC